MVVVTAGMLVVTAGNAWVACNQRTIMQGQLDAAKEANKQNVKNLADASKDTQAALEISRRQAAAIERQAAALDRQITAFENVEAAHLGVSRIESIIGRDEMKIGIPIDNYGRIPSPTMKVRVITGKFTDIKNFEQKVTVHGGDKTQVPPGSGKFGVTVSVPLLPGDAEQLEGRKLQVMVAGTLDWDNGFGKRASAGFCFFYATRAHWDACSVVNYEMLNKLTPSNPVAPEGHGSPISPPRQ